MLNEIRRAFAENKLAILASVAILFISLILGYYLEGYLYSYFNPVVEELTQKVQTGVLSLTFHDIFFNNLKVICAMFILGAIFCFSALTLAFNGFFTGYYIGTSDNLFEVLMYIIPHGIFEFSSCIFACAGGFVLFNFVCKFIKTLLKDKYGSISERIYNSFVESYDKLKQSLILFAIAVILMVIAGIIEAYFTLPIAEFILSLA